MGRCLQERTFCHFQFDLGYPISRDLETEIERTSLQVTAAYENICLILVDHFVRPSVSIH